MAFHLSLEPRNGNLDCKAVSVMSGQNYILITPAKNEEAVIEIPIQAVLKQKTQPKEYVVVSDGSTDRTDLIVSSYAQAHPFIRLLRAPSSSERNFNSKIRAFQFGYQSILSGDYEYIGNLDADIGFQPDYYARLIEEMQKNRRLGIASGVTHEPMNGHFHRTSSSLNHAVGGTMFFRRECFEQVGGYQPVSVEGEDAIAERTARMLGWQTRSFPALPLYHHRATVEARGGFLRTAYRAGLTDYHIGTHPLFALARAARRLSQPPFLLGACAHAVAYLNLWRRRARRDASPQLVKYVYREQMNMLKWFCLGRNQLSSPEK